MYPRSLTFSGLGFFVRATITYTLTTFSFASLTLSLSLSPLLRLVPCAVDGTPPTKIPATTVGKEGAVMVGGTCVMVGGRATVGLDVDPLAGAEWPTEEWVVELGFVAALSLLSLSSPWAALATASCTR